MLPRCRTASEPFVIPTFDVQVSDVEGFMDELQEFQSVFHDCCARSEARGHFLDDMVGPYSPLARQALAPIALAVAGGRIRSLQRFLSETVWDEEQMWWNYHQLVAEELGEPDGVLMGRIYGFGDWAKMNTVSKRPLTQASLRCKRWLNPFSLQRIPTPLNRC